MLKISLILIKIQTSGVYSSNILRTMNAKFSEYLFYVETKI